MASIFFKNLESSKLVTFSNNVRRYAHHARDINLSEIEADLDHLNYIYQNNDFIKHENFHIANHSLIYEVSENISNCIKVSEFHNVERQDTGLPEINFYDQRHVDWFRKCFDGVRENLLKISYILLSEYLYDEAPSEKINHLNGYLLNRSIKGDTDLEFARSFNLCTLALLRGKIHQQYEDDLRKFTDAKNEAINNIDNSISEVHQKYEDTLKIANFFGLSRGFKNMYEQKRKDLKISTFIMYLIGLSILAIMAFYGYFSYFHFIEKQDIDPLKLAYSAPALISIEAILLYFFRIKLQETTSIKGQMLQLQLRESLCAFIESYSGFIKNADGTTKIRLEKFETLIFSNIVSDPTAIPTALDGLEQLTSLFKSATGSKS